MGVALKETLFVKISWFHAFSHLLLSSAKRTITVKKPSPFQVFTKNRFAVPYGSVKEKNRINMFMRVFAVRLRVFLVL